MFRLIKKNSFFLLGGTRRKGIILSVVTREKISSSAASLRGVKIEVVDINTEEKFTFKTLTDAAKYLNVSRTAVSKALTNNTLIKKQFKIQKQQ